MAYDSNEVQAYIRDAARRRNIDPNTALRVFKQESSFNPLAQNISNKEESYGVTQLNAKGGLGAVALQKGINIRDPNTWRQQIDFSLDTVAKDGWRQWYGARDVGIGRWDGINGRTAGGGQTSPLVDAVAARNSGADTLAGGAANDQLQGGQPAAPSVNISLPSERKMKAAESVLENTGKNISHPLQLVGDLAQTWAATRELNSGDKQEASALQQSLAGLDPQYQMAGQLLGGRDGAAKAILASREEASAKANREEARSDRLAAQGYQRDQDKLQNDRADRSLALQEEVVRRKGEGFRTLTPDEVKQRGLPPGSYQVGSDGKIDEIGKSGQTINVNGTSSEFRKKADERMVKRFGDIAEGQTAAANTVQTIPVMRDLLAQAPTGPLAGRLAERFPGFSTAGDAFQATVNQIAPTLRIPGSGAMSDRDMDVLMGSFPRLRNDPNANGLIMGLFEKKAQLNLQRSDIANKALRGEIDPAEADRQLSTLDQTPLLDENMRASLTGKAPQQPTSQDGVPLGGLVPGSDAGKSEAAPVRRARNPQTGQVLELRNGQWVPAQ
ncbi:transglycosylase SLT domain-containing protein [Aureimonas sp. N4]|uniref:transglycosylase SLT domain-containing protein n=1 Tax=Aureimonas sp. N4 TaxID=1638165 RepID=UPI0007847335|nr:transglycosylase SLT domain-containing protein [Aureimonas sp. N4]